MTLTARMVEQAKPREKPYKLSDRDGLYLYVSPTGAKSWRKNYKAHGKQATATFGRWPEMTLADARKACADLGKESTSEQTFEAVFRDWLKVKLPKLSNPKHQAQVQKTIEDFALPYIGNQAINTITRAQFVKVVQAIADRGTVETAHRVAGRITEVMDFAMDCGLVDAHPAAALTRALPPKPKKRVMHCVPIDDVPQLLADIDAYPEDLTRWALQFMALTFVRTTELRAMQWGELRGNDWVIPADRMKRRLPHVVPLSTQALALLDVIRRRTGESEFVFDSPAKPGHAICENTMLFALYRLGYRGRMTGHGFRALASTVLNEQSGFHPDAIERQLAHRETNAVRAAYNRADYLDQRRELMQWWADWLDAQRAAAWQDHHAASEHRRRA